VDGFHGISIEYMRSPKFMAADGGWDRVVWMPASVKERIKDFMPKEVVVATENEAKTVDELKVFLKEQNHPVVQRWKEEAPVEVEPPPETEEGAMEVAPPFPVSTATVAAGGFKIIFKNAKIHAEKVIIKREKTKR
jgi:acetyl-CoA decarbonylase/synthase complex subunit beta